MGRKVARDEDGLSPQEAAWCRYRAQGLDQSAAYRQAWPGTGATPARINDMASRLGAKPRVQARVAALLRAARASDLDSDGAVVADTLAACRAAAEAGNQTALMQGLRLRSQQRAMLRDVLSVSTEAKYSDDELIASLSRGDAAKGAVLRGLIGSKTFH